MAEISSELQEMMDDLGFDEVAKIYSKMLGVDELDGRMYLCIDLGIIEGDVETVDAK